MYLAFNKKGKGTLISCLANYWPDQTIFCGLLSHACVVKVMRQLHVFPMSCGSLQTVIKLNVIIAVAVWWGDVVNKYSDTNLHVM